ncbi:DUF6011 domain-containing protein [Leifsonia sp. NPDC058292]|uniref:DUF6011 domain-containing protein n=1 Tax=Leifsonia sp. NPDC058292 TaxID=3346428 RepID=UPI0036DAFC02
MDRQEALPDAPVARRVRVFCRGIRGGRRCGRELFDDLSRARRLGPECDPETRGGHERRDVDQEPIPGL